MENIILIFFCLLLGIILQRAKDFPVNSYKTLNQFIIYVALPALVLFYIPKIKINSTLLFPLGIAWIGFILSFVFFYFIGKRLGWSNKLIGCLILIAGLGNTSFVGFPIIQALYGDEGLKTAIIIDQPGTFVVLTTFGIITATFFSRGKSSFRLIISKMLLFPPFIATVFACILNLLKVDFPIELQSVFQKLGSTITPIALVAVGLQLTIDRRSKHWGFLALGLFFKLMITPAFFYLFYKIILHGKGLVIDVSIMESAMAPMITGTILAANYGLKPKLSTMMIGIGIPFSFVTLAFWYWILTTF
ncbi:AEC family transporter [Flavobacterium luteum]|uniref:AEC family transporter n=1 Tax=Flavobacterium luteum TaxID=2026654 RepID=A0A7J5AC49_9FLAO|nr:AEC family transporter [Flavobacterium luteum]KAB1155018.1 AEC family transporter [Flavobacterium luteum]